MLFYFYLNYCWVNCFYCLISKFNNRRIHDLAFAYLVSGANIAPDGTYFPQIKQVSHHSTAFNNVLFSTGIQFASDFCWPKV